ncbi:MAG: DUF1287 domain-containing protein [Clostridia bacterium]|nr:DUF1287 domain-containing protein [Clostridia bacterium]
MKKRYIIIPAVIILILCLAVGIADHYLFIIPRDRYSGADFNIARYYSTTDKDGDGLDDQTDIYNATLTYLATNPKYKSKYYEGGYPNDVYGVCTDVVAFALRDAGYDLQALLDADIAAAPEAYPTIEKADNNIDFRRVRNLEVYFFRHATSLTTDIESIEDWQPGDIVTFTKHIAIISANRDKEGRPFILHLASPIQITYEAPLTAYKDIIVSHYRIS